jgi:peroxiredoxin Q/BCP
MRSQKKISVGDRVPEFSLKDQNGVVFCSSDLVGNTSMVIYFYPKDDTPGCTKEACKFRDSYEEFTDRNVKVIGISADDIKSHKKFAEKYNLPFTLLSDPDNKVRKIFGVKSNILGLLPGRVTYIVDIQGNVKFIYDNMFNSEKHIEEAIKAIQE